MRNVTVPLLLPCAPDVMVIQETLLFADHVQPFSVDTVTFAVPAVLLTVWLAGLIVKRHGAASCITRT